MSVSRAIVSIVPEITIDWGHGDLNMLRCLVLNAL